MTKQVLQETDIDRLGQALITLTQELWVVKDRQRVLEAALADAGVLESASVDSYQPGAELQTELQAERRKLIDGIIDTLTAADSVRSLSPRSG